MSKSASEPPLLQAKEVYLPMEPLLTLLRSKGFLIKPDDYIEMLKVVERFGSRDINETAKWICPIIATSEAEQANFYKVVEEYKRLSSYTSKPPKRKFKVLKWLAVALLTGFVAVALYFFMPSTKAHRELVLPSYSLQTATGGDTVIFDASSSIAAANKDTDNIRLQWQFEKGTSAEGFKVSHVFTTTGSTVVTRKLTHKGSLAKAVTDSFYVDICEDALHVQLKEPDEEMVVGKKITFTAEAHSKKGKVLSYEWRVQDTILRTGGSVITYTFNKTGYYTVECTVSSNGAADYCKAADGNVFHVIDPGINYTVLVAGSHVLKPLKTTPKLWVSLLLLIPAAAGLLYSLIKRRIPKHQKKGSNTEVKDELKKDKKKPSYQIPFENNDLKFTKQERLLRNFLLQMRQKAEEENLVLSISKTINSTIRSGGMPSLVYSPCVQRQHYLVLIDQTNPKSTITHLFDYLTGALSEANVPLDKFYYNQQLTCFNPQYPLGISLQRLAEVYSSSSLIILGKAHELVYRGYPVIEEHLLKELEKWENKAIITPVGFADWGEKEKVLSKYLLLLPADVLGLQKLVTALKEKVKNQHDYLKVNFKTQEQLAYTDFKDVNELYDYINDDVLFQWLCAVCVYPKLRWEIFIEVGKTILDKYNEPGKLNYTSLLKLCRISWMQEGVFPQSIRLELLKKLTIDNEIAARETILNMLEYVTVIHGGDNSFEEELERQKLTNKFILYANDSLKYTRYANSKTEFEKLWVSKSILDAPVKKYLDKTPGEIYETPLNNQNRSVILNDYFNLQTAVPKKVVVNKRVVAAIAASVLVVLWCFMYFSNVLISIRDVPLTGINSSQTIPLSIKVGRDFASCGDSSSKSFPDLSGTLSIGGKQFTALAMPLESSLSFNIPYTSFIIAGLATLQLTVTPEETVQSTIDFSKGILPDSITVVCRNITKDSLQPTRTDTTANTNPLLIASLPNTTNEIWYGVKNNRLLTINLAAKTIYYSTASDYSYGTYTITDVYQLPNGMFRVITRFNKQYKAFYLRNVTTQSLDLSVCQKLYNTKEEILKADQTVCDPFYQMKWYYKSEIANTMYLPYFQAALQNKQSRAATQKLISKTKGYDTTKARLSYSFTFYHFNVDPTTPNGVVNTIIKNAGIQSFDVKEEKSRRLIGPFERDELSFEVSAIPKDAPFVNPAQTTGTLITADQLTKITGNKSSVVTQYTTEFNKQFPANDITTVNRMAAFISQMTHESGRFKYFEEISLNLTAENIFNLYPQKFKTLQEALPYANNAAKLANYIYANRLGNGNEASGDGYKYRGRGLLLLTGKTNYEMISKLTGIDFVTNPDYLLQPSYAAAAACAWWKSQNLNSLADKEDIVAITRKINGGTNGLDNRKALYITAKAVLSETKVPVTKQTTKSLKAD